ncbi:MAG: serine/threonine-protein kinase [Byssovorax sp.]
MVSAIRSRLREGSVFGGKYQIESVLGEGAMGIVVAARHVDFGRRFAIKCLLPGHRDDRGMVARFQREARATARLKSEHIARVVDAGDIELCPGEPSVHYLVMEHHEGADLRSLMKSGGPFSIREAADYVSQACLGLAEAHALGIVHRDLKPANLFRTRRADGTCLIKVIDFGIAKYQSPNTSGDALDVTECASMMGTLHYMAPEQMVDAKSVDGRADVWSLGVTLYELCTGKKPFTGVDSTDLTFSILASEPRPLAELLPAADRDFSRVVMRCLARTRDNRMSSVVELARALAPYASRPASAPGSQLLRSTARLTQEEFQEFRRSLQESDTSTGYLDEDAEEPPTRRFAAA